MTPAWWALGISALSLLVAAIALTWQIASFLLSGARTKAEARLLTIYGVGEPFESVTGVLSNVGRQPISVHSVWLQIDEENSLFVPVPHPMNQPLPATLPPGHDLSHVFPVEIARTWLAKKGQDHVDLRVGFALAGGRKTVSKDPVRVALEPGARQSARQ